MSIDTYSYLLPLVTGMASFLIGVTIIVRDWRQSQARVFALFSIALSMWLLGSACLVSFCTHTELALLIDRIIYIFVAAIPAVLFHFTSTSLSYKKRKKSIIVGYFIMSIFWVIIWTPYFIDGLYYFSNSCHGRAGIFHHFFLFYFLIYSLYVIYDSFVLYKQEQIRFKKIQYQFILFTLFSEAVVAVVAFLPAYNIDSYWASNSIAFVSILILVYAMLRHNLFELKVVAINIFISVVVVASFLQIFFAVKPILRFINAIVFVVIVVLGFLVKRNVRDEIENREKGERLARNLANANARLRELDKQKTEFVSIASHQLRSPIAAIKGYTSMITEGSFGKVPKSLDEPLSRILESGQRIAIMVDDFLNVTRIEQGRMTYDMKPHNVYTLVSLVIKELKVVAEKKGLQLSITDDSNTTSVVKADEGKLKQIFSNLIDNAIKYTPQGSITVSVELLSQYHRILIKIKDTGIGIASDEVQHLFKKFNRASNANEVNVLGTGLGLYIAREIMKAHEGWINVESEGVGKGSTFIVELPVCSEDDLK